MRVKTEYATYEDCHLNVDRYTADYSLAIMIYNEEDGPIANLTKCLPSNGFVGDDTKSFVDTNNCPWAEDFIKEYHLGAPTGLFEYSGYCAYPLYKFNLDELEKYAK